MKLKVFIEGRCFRLIRARHLPARALHWQAGRERSDEAGGPPFQSHDLEALDRLRSEAELSSSYLNDG